MRILEWDRQGWRNLAACRGSDPELFFPLGTTGLAVDHIEAARTVCQSCVVRETCLRFALETNQEAGIWGGTTEDERRRMRRTWVAGGRQRLEVSP